MSDNINNTNSSAQVTPTAKQNLVQSVKFLLFSISAGIIQVASFTLLNELLFQLPYWPAYLLALTLSVLWNFTLNREFTFKSANNIPIAMLKVALFYVVFTPLSTWAGNALESVGWNAYLVLALSMLVNFVLEFLYSKFVTFRGSENTNKRAKKDVGEDKSGNSSTESVDNSNA